jgi:CO/xanthine dehydrogenase FAD-binding subunit
MRPAPFSYSRPATIAEALRALGAGGVPLAGGQSLIQAMRLRTAEPRALVDLAGVAELSDTITITDQHVVIGARVTHRALLEHPTVAREMPWLTAAAQALGDVQVRNRGTVLGNVCWADPRANWTVAMLASDAAVSALSPQEPSRVQRIATSEFFTGYRSQVLGNRLATALEVPRRHGARGSYVEFARQPQDLALVNVCVVTSSAGTRVAVGGIDARPVRLRGVESALDNGGDLDAVLAASLAPSLHTPVADTHGSASYKLGLAATLIKRALTTLGGAA